MATESGKVGRRKEWVKELRLLRFMLAMQKARPILFGEKAELLSSSFFPTSWYLRKAELKWSKGEIW